MSSLLTDGLHGEPTVASGCGSPIITWKGDPFTGRLSFFTSIECNPVSSGVNSSSSEPSGAIPHLTGSFFPEGRVNSALSFGKSSGKLISSLLTDALHGWPSPGEVGSAPEPSPTRTLNGDPLTGLPFFLTSME